MDNIRAFLSAAAVAALPFVATPAHAATQGDMADGTSLTIAEEIEQILLKCGAEPGAPAVLCGTFKKEGAPSFAHISDPELKADLKQADQFSIMLQSHINSSGELVDVFALRFETEEGDVLRNEPLTFGGDGQTSWFKMTTPDGQTINILDVLQPTGITFATPTNEGPAASVDKDALGPMPRPSGWPPADVPADDPYPVHPLASYFNCLSPGQVEIVNFYELVDSSKNGGDNPDLAGLYRYDDGTYKILLIEEEKGFTGDINVGVRNGQFYVPTSSGVYTLPQLFGDNGFVEIEKIRVDYDPDDNACGADTGPGIFH